MIIRIQPLLCPQCKEANVTLLDGISDVGTVDKSTLICNVCQLTFLAKSEYFGPEQEI
jgi:hypothetical protein